MKKLFKLLAKILIIILILTSKLS